MSARSIRESASRVGVVALGILLLLAQVNVANAQVRPATAEVTRVTGQVEILRKGGAQWVQATVGARLAERDEIRTFAGAWAEMTLPDASTVVLAENSRLVVTRLEADPRTQARSSIFHLVVGKVRAAIAQATIQLVRARQSTFAISTPTAVAAARGTIMALAFVPAVEAHTTMACAQTDIECICGDPDTLAARPFPPDTSVSKLGRGPCGAPQAIDPALFNLVFSLVTAALLNPGPSPIVDPSVVDTIIEIFLAGAARVGGGSFEPVTHRPFTPTFPSSDFKPGPPGL